MRQARNTEQALPDITVQYGKAIQRSTGRAVAISDEQAQKEIEDRYKNLPVVECRPANLSLFRIIFSLIFGAGFLSPVIAIAKFSDIGHMSMTVNGKYVEDAGVMGYVFLAPFFLVGLGALIVFLLPFIRLLMLALFGQKCEGEIVGYIGDDLYINGNQTLCAMIRTFSKEQPQLIKYKTGLVAKPYPVGTRVHLKKYHNLVKMYK